MIRTKHKASCAFSHCSYMLTSSSVRWRGHYDVVVNIFGQGCYVPEDLERYKLVLEMTLLESRPAVYHSCD
jgi:hypothetical protein